MCVVGDDGVVVLWCCVDVDGVVALWCCGVMGTLLLSLIYSSVIAMYQSVPSHHFVTFWMLNWLQEVCVCDDDDDDDDEDDEDDVREVPW